MYRKYVPFLLFLFFLYGCNGNKQEEKEDVSVFVDLPQLKAEGEITAVTYTVLPPTSNIRCNPWVTNTI